MMAMAVCAHLSQPLGCATVHANVVVPAVAAVVYCEPKLMLLALVKARAPVG